MSLAPHLFDACRPQFPVDRRRYGIAIVGGGNVVRRWHLPTYLANGLRVVGVWDHSCPVRDLFREQFPDVPLYPSLPALLNDPHVDVVDIATSVPGRPALLANALRAGKHVLAQKPLCQSAAELTDIRTLAAAAPHLRIAVNHNGRWAPQWRAADLLIRDGAIGDVFAITHLHDFRMSWLPDPNRHGSPHFLVFDYGIHWIDISLCWLGKDMPRRVWAMERSRPKPEEGLLSQTAWIAIQTDYADIVIRSVADARRNAGHPFVIHGSLGSLRGSVDSPETGDWLELERGSRVERIEVGGNWFPDGFAGSIGELLCAIESDRDPYHSLAHAARSHEVLLACVTSIETGGSPVDLTRDEHP